MSSGVNHGLDMLAGAVPQIVSACGVYTAKLDQSDGYAVFLDFSQQGTAMDI